MCVPGMKLESKYIIHTVGMVLFIVHDENYINKLTNLLLIFAFSTKFWSSKLMILPFHIYLQHLPSPHIVTADGRD
jgi:hypothetical protein